MPFVPALFRLDCPGRPPPEFHVLTEAERVELNRRAAERLSWDDLDEWLRVPWVAFDQARTAPGFRASDDAFCPADVADALGLSPAEEVVADWFGGDQVRFRWADACAHFADLWTAGEDDVAFFDESFDWLVYATRGGEIRWCAPIEAP